MMYCGKEKIAKGTTGIREGGIQDTALQKAAGADASTRNPGSGGGTDW